MLNKVYKKNVLILVAIVLIFTVSCNQDPAGIFATIERTQAVDLGNKMMDNTAVLALAEFDGEDSHKLYAATGRRLMRRAFDLHSDWSTMERPDNTDGIIDLVFTSSTANQAAALFTDGNTISLHTATGSSINAASYTPSSWSKVSASLIAGTPNALFTADDKLFVATRDEDIYRLYWYGSDANTWEELPFDQSPTEIRGVAENEGTVYVLSSDKVFSGDLDSMSPLSDQPDIDTPDFTALLINPEDNRMIITTSAGRVVATHTDTIDWNISNKLELSSGSEARLTSIVRAPSDLGVIYIVGVNQGGIAFYQNNTIESPGESAINNTNFAGSKLRRTSIIRLLTNSDGKPLNDEQVIFAGSAGNGLWRGRVTDSSTIVWGQE